MIPEGNVGDEEDEDDESNPRLQGCSHVGTGDSDVKQLWKCTKEHHRQDLLQSFMCVNCVVMQLRAKQRDILRRHWQSFL